MGLTIHYEFTTTGSRRKAETIIKCLQGEATALPFKAISEVKHFQGELCNPERWRNTDWFWPLVIAQRYVQHGRRSIGITPLEVYVFSVLPGEDCESVEIGLARYPQSVKVHPALCITHGTPRYIQTHLKGWSWSGFCKTQYASVHGIPHFLQCHISVCALLKQAEKYLQVNVSDEGEFWTHWDPDRLVQTVCEWDTHIARAVRQIEAALGDQYAVHAVMHGHPEYYRIIGLNADIAEVLAGAVRTMNKSPGQSC